MQLEIKMQLITSVKVMSKILHLAISLKMHSHDICVSALITFLYF